MTMLELYENGVMDFLVKGGAISIDRYAYKRYYDVWMAYRDKGYGKQKSYDYTCDECGICETTLRKAIDFITYSP